MKPNSTKRRLVIAAVLFVLWASLSVVRFAFEITSALRDLEALLIALNVFHTGLLVAALVYLIGAAYLLIMLGVALGALSAATAYIAPLSLDGEALTGLRLKEPAGIGPDDQPLFPAGTELTPEVIQSLRDAGVTHVWRSDFSWKTWDTRFMLAFIGSCVMLLGGGLMVRAAARKRLATVDESETMVRPEHAVAALAATARNLRAELPTLPTERNRLQAIIERLNEAQRTNVADFIDARDRLIAKHGLARFAVIMDRFAAGERAINRAWSAAADDHLPEAEASLDEAAARLAETAEALDA